MNSGKKVNDFCCGFIGTKKTSFCLKNKVQCTVLKNKFKHATIKFSLVYNSYYIYKSSSEDPDWCQYTLPVFSIMSMESATIQVGYTDIRTLDYWKTMFKYLNSDENATEEELNQSV